MAEKITQGLGQWINNIFNSEQIPPQSAQDSSGWISLDGKIELMRGRLLIGTEETANGFVKGHGFGYKADGTTVQFRKINTKIQYYNGSTWADTVTGLTSTAEYTFARYQSLAGTFVYATWADWIYKIHTAFPWAFASMYDSTKNFKGKSIISTGRMIMWDVTAGTAQKDTTGLYGSYIDAQNSGVYTTVSGEATTSLTGTLAFKAWDAKRTCFWVIITLTWTGEVYTDNYLGVLTGSLGGTGTINYITWAYTMSNAWVGTANYLWEMTNNHWVTDFTHSAIRLASEGFVFRQDEGGDAIAVVTVHNGSYYSIKTRSVYQLTIGSDDTTATNIVFRKDIGVPYWRATVTTGQGVVFMNTANLDKPQLTILTPNQLWDNLIPVTLASQFDFSLYTWSACSMTTFGEFIVFSGMSFGATTNDTLFLYNFRRKTLDVLPYAAKTMQDINGELFIGDTLTDNVYQIFSGFDDDGDTISNYWISWDELFGTQRLKKTKRLRIKWLIQPTQSLQVYVSTDWGGFTLVGTILGNWTYVSLWQSFTIWANGIWDARIGGEASDVDWYQYFAELQFSFGKFRKRTIKLVANGIGYVSCDMYIDEKLQLFENKLPSAFRSKQNVSLDGTLTDQ